MQELQTLLQQTRRKLELLEQQELLTAESRQLDTETHNLKIQAHNEQADVDNLSAPGIQSFFLGLTGRKQERLDKEQAEARHAQQRYASAVARQASVRQQLAECAAELEALGTCEKELQELIAFPENAALSAVVHACTVLPQIQGQINPLIADLETVATLGAACQSRTAALAGTVGKLLAAERSTQNKLSQFQADLADFEAAIAPFGIAINTEALHAIKDHYLTDLYTGAIIVSRADNACVALRHAGFQLDAAKPKLAQLQSQYTRLHLQALIDAAGKL